MGIDMSLKMRKIGQGMFFAKRMSPFEFFVGHGCKDKSGLTAMLRKAREIEESKAKEAK